MVVKDGSSYIGQGDRLLTELAGVLGEHFDQT
jgi:hypothetical protein